MSYSITSQKTKILQDVQQNRLSRQPIGFVKVPHSCKLKDWPSRLQLLLSKMYRTPQPLLRQHL